MTQGIDSIHADSIKQITSQCTSVIEVRRKLGEELGIDYCGIEKSFSGADPHFKIFTDEDDN